MGKEKYSKGEINMDIKDLINRKDSLDNMGRYIPLFGNAFSRPFDFKKPSDPDQSSQHSKGEKSTQEILAPFERVFFDASLMDDLLVRTSIPQLLNGQEPLYPGAILFGPPGTGKSEFQRAVVKAYQLAGAYGKEISPSSINTCWVGESAKNLEKELEKANEEGKKRRLGSFLSFDEGSIFAQKADVGSSNVSKHYQEMIDTFKRYIGNEAGKWVVVAVSTNCLPRDFEDAMTREGRLTSFFVDYPSQEQTAKMWKFFLNHYKVLEINDDQASELAEIIPGESGALIDKFCEAYVSLRRQLMLAERGYSSLLDALKENVHLSERDVKASISFESLTNDARAYASAREKRNGLKERRVGFIR